MTIPPNKWKPIERKNWFFRVLDNIIPTFSCTAHKKSIAIKFEIKKFNLPKMFLIFADLPYKKIFNFMVKLILIAGSFALAITVYLNFQGMKFIEERQTAAYQKIITLINDDYKELKFLANENKEQMDYLKAHAIIVRHERVYVQTTVLSGRDRGKQILIEKEITR